MFLRPLSSALQKKAVTELNEVPDRVQRDLEHIKDWLTKQPHLRARTDDQWLLNFLRGCKFSLQRTKEKLDLFYTIKLLTPEFFSKRDPFLPEIQEFLQRSIYLPLPKTSDAAGPRVILVRAKSTDPEKIPFVFIAKMIVMNADILVHEDDNFMIAGVNILFDLQDIPYQYVMQITPSILKKLLTCLLVAYPIRVKGIYFINSPSIFESVFNLLKKLSPEKIANRIELYTKENFNTLFNNIPLSILPKEYGGESDSVDKIAADWRLKVESYRDWFVQDANYYSDETKRLGKPKTSADLYGVEGSFRKLEVD